MAKRRLLLGAMAAALLAPRLLIAQAARKSMVVLFAGEEDDDEPAARPFFEEMKRLGWTEGGNIAYERFYGRGTREYMDGLAKSAAERKPDLIYAATTNIALAVLKEEAPPPLVFNSATDPARAGLVASLERPGGSATGAFHSFPDAARKRLELMHEAFPGLARIGILIDRRSTDYAQQKRSHEQAARLVGIELELAEFTNYETVARALANFRRAGIRAGAITPSVTLTARRREVADTALLNKVALVGHRVEWADAGALLSYGADIAETLRRSARVANRILKGAAPATIPVERVTKLELVVNRKTAKALGVELPARLLKRADRVIEA